MKRLCVWNWLSTTLRFLTAFNLTFPEFYGTIPNLETSNTRKETMTYVNNDYVEIQKEISEHTFEKFRLFCQNMTSMKKRADSTTALGKEEIHKRIGTACQRYLYSDVFSTVGRETKTKMSAYISQLLDMKISDIEESTALAVIDKSAVTTSSVVSVPTVIPMENEKANIYVNVIVPKGASILVCKVGETWTLPGGWVKNNETPREASARHVRDMSSVNLLEHKFQHLNSYEVEDGSRFFIVTNYMYMPSYKPTATATSKVDKAEFIDFTKALELNLSEEHEKIIRMFIMR